MGIGGYAKREGGKEAQMKDPVLRLSLEVSLLEQLQELSRQRNKPMAAIVRDLINQAAPDGRKDGTHTRVKP
jgi:Ribbon-helix-helix protein, copG family